MIELSYVEDIENIEIIDEPYFSDIIMSEAGYTDPVSERHRRVENIALGRGLIKAFRTMGEEARNRFRELSRNEQIKLISNRKREARSVLQYGSLFPYEKMKLIDKVNEKVDNIYTPFMKWSRKELANQLELSPSL